MPSLSLGFHFPAGVSFFIILRSAGQLLGCVVVVGLAVVVVAKMVSPVKTWQF